MNERELFTFLRIKGREAKKSLGQHFLINPNVSKKIVETLALTKNDEVLEIGAGFAALSYYLVQKPAHITLLDVDNDAISFLRNLFAQKENVTIVSENVLTHKIDSYDLIIGNIPYYLTKHVLQYVLLNASKARRIVLMLQKEAAEKLFLKTYDKNFNPLAILINYLGSVQKVLDVSKKHFSPRPKVDSTVINIELTNERNSEQVLGFYNFLNELFKHKRKTIHNNLTKTLKNAVQSEDAFKHLKIDKNRRPHELSLEEFYSLFNYLSCKKS